MTTFTKKAIAVGLLGAGLSLLGATSSFANIVYMGPTDLTGTGLGAVNTLFQIQDSINGSGGFVGGNANGIESGCVAYNGTTTTTTCFNGVQGGDEKNNPLNTFQLSTILSGAQTAGDLRFVVNANEPGNDQSVTLTNLYLALFNTTSGTTTTFSYAGAPLVLTNPSASGTGSSGFLFGLDPAQAAQATAFCSTLSTCFAGGGLQFGLGTTAGGPETLFLTSAVRGGGGGGVPSAIPEPETVALFGIGLLALAASRRRKA